MDDPGPSHKNPDIGERGGNETSAYRKRRNALERWGEAHSEAMFKQVNGDFVFRAPGLLPRHYLVSVTQKAEILRLLRKGPRLDLWILGGVAGAILSAVIARSSPWPDLVNALALGGTQWISVLWAISRRIRPALVGARSTEKRIALRERNETFSRLTPMSDMIGVAFLFLLIFIGLVVVSLIVPDEKNLRLILWATSVVCAFVAGYYFYLAMLKVLRS
jgi:hypothetical protein